MRCERKTTRTGSVNPNRSTHSSTVTEQVVLHHNPPTTHPTYIEHQGSRSKYHNILVTHQRANSILYTSTTILDFDFTKYNKEKYQNQITAETRFKLNTSYKEDTQYTPISHDRETQVTGFGVYPLTTCPSPPDSRRIPPSLQLSGLQYRQPFRQYRKEYDSATILNNLTQDSRH